MRYLILLFFFMLGNLFSYSQDTLKCGFERLFTIKPGMDKAQVMDLVNENNYGNLLRSQIEKLPPYTGSGGDSILKEVLIYTPTGVRCFKGNNTLLKLEFADNKLYKAYISTEYSKASYKEMISNYNLLRDVIKAQCPYEKEVKVSSEKIVGFGYNYTKTKDITDKAEMISVQYIDTKVKDMKSAYMLELLWANLTNTRMKSSNF